MPAAIAPVAGAVVGGLMSKSGGGGESQTQSRDPWAPAQPWLRQNLQTGQNLQGYYEQNPFNSLQQTSYQNIAGDIDNFRQNINPGLMEFANRLMGTNYSRQGGPSGQSGGRQSSSGSAGQGGQGAMSGLEAMFGAQSGARGQPNATQGSADDIIQALLMTPKQSQQGLAMGQGLLSTKPMQMGGGMGRSGPFVSAPGQSYGLIDWREMNPFTATNGIQPAPVEAVETEDERARRLREEAAARQQQEDQYRGAGA